AYDGFGQRHISFSWPDEAGQTQLHEAAAFGRPTQAAAVLAKNPGCWGVKTSLGRTAHDVALDAVAWCEKHNRSALERHRHAQVADLCRRAQDAQVISEPVLDEDATANEPGPPGYFQATSSLPGLRQKGLRPMM
ncbi:unnamed protein product, partial [Polarella glacialis]